MYFDPTVFTEELKEDVKKEIWRELSDRHAPGIDQWWAQKAAEELWEEHRRQAWQKTAPGGGLASQGKGILYGVGTAALLALLFPSFGQKLQAVFARTALEGVGLLQKARSTVAKAREDIEDLIAEANLKGQL